MAPNTPPMLEAHFAVPMLGAVLNALNVRLDAETVAYILGHGEAKVLITDREFSATVAAALALLPPAARPLVIDVDDALAPPGSCWASRVRGVPRVRRPGLPVPCRPTSGTPSR